MTEPTKRPDERKLFEQWLSAREMRAAIQWLKLDEDGSYFYGTTETSWCAWKRRAELDTAKIDEMRAALERAGSFIAAGEFDSDYANNLLTQINDALDK